MLVAQILFALSAVDKRISQKQVETKNNTFVRLEEEYRDKNTPGTSSWLESWGFFSKFHSVLERPSVFGTALQNIIIRFGSTFIHDPENASKHFSYSLSRILKSKENCFNDMNAALTYSLSLSNFQPWAQFWALVLSSKVQHDKEFATLFNELILIAISLGHSISFLDPILSSLCVKKPDIMRTFSTYNLPFLCYGLALNFRPKLPKNASWIENSENQLSILKDVALKLKDKILALLFWEQFFRTLFESKAESIVNCPFFLA